jgi:hypothetical protein
MILYIYNMFKDFAIRCVFQPWHICNCHLFLSTFCLHLTSMKHKQFFLSGIILESFDLIVLDGSFNNINSCNSEYGSG